jgi:hypothetical protein
MRKRDRERHIHYGRTIPAFLAAFFGLLSFPGITRAEDARTLPKGRSRLSFTYAKSNGITQQYNDSGVAESFTKPYNMNLNADKIGTFAASISPQFGNLVSLLNETGLRYDASQSGTVTGGITGSDPSKPLLGDALTKGFLGVDASATQSQSVIQYMTGLTDRLSVGFMVPIITTTVKAGAEISKINNTVQDYERAFSGDPATYKEIIDGLEQLDAANIETLQQYALTNNGYKRFGSSETTGLGDVNFGGRYNYLKTPRDSWINSVQLSISAPTGKTHPANAITEVDNGAGTWTATGAHIVNWAPFGPRSPFSFSHGDHVTYQLPGKKIMRVRTSPDDILPDASTEEEVRTAYGTKIWTNLGSKYTFNPMWSFETSYEWYWKGRDGFSGTRDKDYTYLGDNTATYLETLTLQGNFSLIDSFTNHRFPLPIDASLSYNKTTTGRNKPITSFWVLELAMYF